MHHQEKDYRLYAKNKNKKKNEKEKVKKKIKKIDVKGISTH